VDDSLLISLRNYRPREGRDSLENFVTEAFAWLLRNSVTAHKSLLTLLDGHTGGRWAALLGESASNWETQLSLDGKRPDMALIGDGVALIFEHKVGASLHEAQLSTYRELSDKRYPNADVAIVLITANMGQQPPAERHAADVCLIWAQVYEALDSELERNQSIDEVERSRLGDFMELLKYEGLGPAEPVSYQAAQYYPTTVSLPDELQALLTQIKDRFSWPLSHRYTPHAHGLRWGRVGIEFTLVDEALQWAPGLTLGCVLDGRDHCIEHRTRDYLRLQLMLDFSSRLRRYYPGSPVYQRFQKNLAEKAEKSSLPINLYDHLADQPRNANKYHPLFLETPLLDVLRRTETAAEQQQRFVDFGNEALRLVYEAGLAELIDDCLAQVVPES
tara:strand:+ start:2247 stop:3413 length:1167 start_codon:yes stop_codon:yes gene_type:complete